MDEQSSSRWHIVLFCMVFFWIVFLIFWVASQTGVSDRDFVSLRTQNDITQLSNALQNFKQKYGLYPPSYIILGSTRKIIEEAPAVQDGDGKTSLAYLEQIWPRLDWSGNSGELNWGGEQGEGPFGPHYLEGDQCLVFFLGGITSEKGCQGFSTNPKNPTLTGGDRVSFFEFYSSRLHKRTKDNRFASYLDNFGKGSPYIYFSSGKRHNDYDEVHQVLGVRPYFCIEDGVKSFHNSKTFQLISAGPDNKFGPGGRWSPETAAADAGPDGADNLVNFNGGARLDVSSQ